jgi:signal peptidase I
MNQDSDQPPPNQPKGDNLHSKGPKIGAGLANTITSFVLFIIIPVGIALILTAFIIQSYQVDGQSMETTLQDHDRLIVDKVPRTLARLTHHAYIPKRGDIVVFNQSGLPDAYYQKQLIKRVIGLPGERVVINNGSITIFNKDQPEGFNPDTTDGYRIAQSTDGNVDVVLQPDEIFVCGDNRDNSEDSRYLPINNTQTF